MKPEKIEHALIMAAGRGMRMMPLTEIIPKPMAPYKGSTLITDGIKKMEKVVENIHVTVGYKGSLLAKHVIDIGVTSIFDTQSHGNSWWVYNTLIHLLDKPVIVLTCDNIVDLDFDLLTENYYAAGCPACMLIPVQPKPGLDGDYIFHEEHRVTALDRNKKSDIYCSGIQIINPYKVHQMTTAVDSFYQLWDQLIELGELYCSEVYPKKWMAIDTMEQLNDVVTTHSP